MNWFIILMIVLQWASVVMALERAGRTITRSYTYVDVAIISAFAGFITWGLVHYCTR